MKEPKKNWSKSIIKISFSALLLYVIFSRTDINAIVSNIRLMDLRLAPLILFFLVAKYIVSALRWKQLLIFDEATSQVDADSEAKIHRAIEEIMRDRTSFIIAHRFSTVVSADVIVVMDNGRILAQGQHDDLVETCPLYQSLYLTQLVVRE